MRILVTGKEGQVDTSLSHLAEATGHDLVRLGLPEIDLSRPETLDDPIRQAQPDVIISSAAYTSVDKAEDEPDLAQKINGDGPGALARIAADLGVPIIHLSTDYVFAGDKDGPYTEADRPSPKTVYGATKLDGEHQIAAATDNHVILRTAWVYSAVGHNFVKTMLRLGESREVLDVVSDQLGSPTYAPDLAQTLLLIAQQIVIDANPTIRGVFHLTGSGSTSWAGFAKAIFANAERRGRRPVRVNPVHSSQFPSRANRPANSRLSCDKLDELYGLCLPDWQDSLDTCLDILIPGEDR